MKKILMAAVLASLVGCATVGNNFSDSDVASIQKGVTTEQSVLVKFGTPTTITSDSEGNKVYSWTYAQANAFSVGQGKVLVVKINKAGVVESYILSVSKP